MCQKAVDVVDRHGRPVEGRDLLNSALSVLATIQCSKAAFDALDATGRYSPAVATAAERMLEEYRRTGRQGKIGDIAVSQGILLYVRARLLDLSRGVTVPARENLPVLLRDAIGLARPFADQVLDAALVLADVLIVLVALQSQADPADSVHAERCLRHFAKTSDLAAAALGQLLAAQTTAQSSQIIQGAVADLPSIIGRQKEAVALLRRCRAWFARYPLAQALSQLSGLLVLPSAAGDDQDIPTRAEAIEVWRSLVGKVPRAEVQLTLLLCDQAARLLRDRASEAVDLAREAVALAGNLPQPGFIGLAGLAETNLAAAQLTLGGASDTRELVVRAIKHIEPLVPHLLYSGLLANTCMNLAQVELNDGHFSEALRLAKRAIDLFDTHDIFPLLRENRPLALLALGRAQRGSGQTELGTATLYEVINRLRAAARDHERGVFVLAGALNQAAPDFGTRSLRASLIDLTCIVPSTLSDGDRPTK